ncbi:MAG: ribonuclease Z [Candidatus Amulumruptor caecigallinarius]|nr:ribonuclease Z [Candidatus Amulumruptor caecigallinarius]MCM1397187.1 ribonuclease Z [Candidatus Amulumruptor caecigallinarius]MCM1453124.1 ribonuclease Z [bacterium]
MRFELNILGCGSATPTARHNPSSQIVNFRDKLFMIDCGEGAQVMMKRMGLKFSRLSHIFISHLHGDHCFGLPGLLSTMSLHEKGGSVTVHLPRGGRAILEPMIRYFCDNTSYELRFEEHPARPGVIYQDSALTVETFPLYHRVPCSGFIFREAEPLLNLRGDMVKFHQVPVSAMHSIKCGEDFVKPDGTVVPNALLTLPRKPAVSYAYCSDTMADPRVTEAVRGVDVIYHEATYADDQAQKARQRGHSTAREAGITAREAGARQLIIGHYSKRYADVTPLLQEAREEFPHVIAADEGQCLDLRALAADPK